MAKVLPHYNQIKKICDTCEKGFTVFPYRAKEAKFCSMVCRNLSYIGKHFSPATEIKKGQHLSPETEAKKGQRLSLIIGYRGNTRSYSAIHNWMYRNYGKANKCSLCHTKKKVRFEWSNKTGKYLNDIKDWWQLCQSCHRNYDIKNNVTKKAYEKLLKKEKEYVSI